jgi:hypothetical protein
MIFSALYGNADKMMAGPKAAARAIALRPRTASAEEAQ